MTDINKQIEEALRSKIKNCKNSTTIFDTRDYVLIDDAIGIVSSFIDSSRWRKVSEELPDKSCEVLVKDSVACMYIAYFSYGKFILNRDTQINGDIIEWKPID